jgi:4-amino-4-deoxy-L-arabinose transferase-like glycosyltransferase
VKVPANQQGEVLAAGPRSAGAPDGGALARGVGSRGHAALGRLAGLIDRAAERPGLAPVILIILALLAFAPGFATMPPMDRDESRFAQATKQMLESRDFVNIRFQDEARLKKPIGIYWLQALAVSTAEAVGASEARTTIAFYRIPSLVAAIAAVLLTWWTALPLAGRKAALFAGAMMAASILLGVEARLAKTDAALLATTLAMVGVLARLFMAPPETGERRERSLALPLVFWTAMAASILIKGPIAPLVVGLTIATLVLACRRWRWLMGLRPLLGVGWALVLVAPWFIAIMIETGGRFLQLSVGDDMMNKVAGGQESHGAPPGVYLVAFWVTFWPAAPLALAAAPWVWTKRRDTAVRFLLCWIVPTWLFFEFVPTKLPHYVLPVYPGIAILIAMALSRDALWRSRWVSAILLLMPLVAIAIAGAALAGVWYLEGNIAWLVLPFGLLSIAAAVQGWRLTAGGLAEQGFALSALAATLAYWGVYGAAMPQAPSLWPSPRLASAAASMDCPSPAFASAGFREPSLVFLVSTGLAMPNGKGAADFLAGGECRMAFVDRRQEEAFLARSAAIGITPALQTRVEGINLNGGRKLHIGVYRRP